MPDLVRKEVFELSETLIIKVGSNVMTREDDRLDHARIQHLADQIDQVLSTGRKVVVVSSGAVAAGIGILKLPGRPQSLPELQAAAAVGQTHLMKAWENCLMTNGHHSAQMLVTVNDFRNRRRYLNVRNTLRTLLNYRVVPVINENDTVSIEEIALGDNDQLAAMVAAMLPRPLLVILSGVDGLFDGDPTSPNSRLVPIVQKPDEKLLTFASSDTSNRGRGGMSSKLRAILSATVAGDNVILANGRQPDILDSIRAGQEVGTLFLASGGVIPAWKRWIAYTTVPLGTLTLDDGAARAVSKQGRSLLAVGIRSVTGEFDPGASVALVTADGSLIGRGLVNYSSTDIRRIAGQKSDQIPELLGHVSYSEVIHRDNLVITSVDETSSATLS